MIEPAKYAKLIEKALPNFVECKSFMSVGFSRSRLPYSSMPLHEEIKEFSEKLSNSLGYKIADEKKDSRVVLLKKWCFYNSIMQSEINGIKVNSVNLLGSSEINEFVVIISELFKL